MTAAAAAADPDPAMLEINRMSGRMAARVICVEEYVPTEEIVESLREIAKPGLPLPTLKLRPLSM